jgi:hypothetical protein
MAEKTGWVVTWLSFNLKLIHLHYIDPGEIYADFPLRHRLVVRAK